MGSWCRRNVDVSRVEGWFGCWICEIMVKWGGESVGNIRGLRVTLRVNLGWFGVILGGMRENEIMLSIGVGKIGYGVWMEVLGCYLEQMFP